MKKTTYFLGFGMVALGIKARCGLGTYSLEKTKVPAKIGRTVKKRDLLTDGPRVEIHFANAEAVSREIRRLQRLRRIMAETELAKNLIDVIVKSAPKIKAVKKAAK